jgi:hypothetical protein
MTYDLDVPELAYLLGFLLGDGHLSAGRGRKGSLAVELHVKDRELLERLVPLLPGSSLSGRVRRTNFSNGDYETAVLSCCGMEVRHALMAAGMPVGRKGATVRPPAIPYSLRDFARGLCDADGSVGFTGKGLPFVSFVTNSPAMADWWCERVIAHVGTVRTWKPNARDGVANLMVVNEAAVALSGWLYQDGDLALARKAEAAAEIRAWLRPPGMRRAYTSKRWTPEEDALVLEGGRTQLELAALLDRTVQSVNLRAWRLRKGASP